MIRLKQIPVGPMNNFSYLIAGSSEKTGTVIDPGWSGTDVDNTIDMAEREGISIKYIVVTHAHYDHVSGVDDMMKKTGAEFFIHRDEASSLQNVHVKGSHFIKDGDQLDLGGFTARIIHTPGHSPGGICIYTDNKLFTGDTLFVGGCGRADLPGSDPQIFYSSLYETLLSLPDETEIYPGHDYGDKPVSTIGEERMKNPYLACHSIDQFVKLRMGG